MDLIQVVEGEVFVLNRRWLNFFEVFKEHADEIMCSTKFLCTVVCLNRWKFVPSSLSISASLTFKFAFSLKEQFSKNNHLGYLPGECRGRAPRVVTPTVPPPLFRNAPRNNYLNSAQYYQQQPLSVNTGTTGSGFYNNNPNPNAHNIRSRGPPVPILHQYPEQQTYPPVEQQMMVTGNPEQEWFNPTQQALNASYAVYPPTAPQFSNNLVPVPGLYSDNYRNNNQYPEWDPEQNFDWARVFLGDLLFQVPWVDCFYTEWTGVSSQYVLYIVWFSDIPDFLCTPDSKS